MRIFFDWVITRGLPDRRAARRRAKRMLRKLKWGRGLTASEMAWAYRYGIQSYVSISGSYPEFIKDLFRV